MPDNLAGQSPADKKEDSLSGAATPSPLEQSSPPPPPPNDPTPAVPAAPAPSIEPTTNAVGEPPVTPVAPIPAPSSEPVNVPVGGPPEEKTAEVPDTEEFLKNILGDTPPEPTSPAPAPSENIPAPEPPVPGTPDRQLPEPEALGTPGEPKIKDSVSGLDEIMGGGAPPAQGKTMDMNPPDALPDKPSRSPLKAIVLIVVIVILVVLGYVAYTRFLVPSSTSSTTSTGSPTEEESVVAATSAVAATSDETRKTDLTSLQTALKNYYAGTGSYPVSNTLALLDGSTDVLSKSLVSQYIDAVPTDPNYPTAKYGYLSDGKTFTLSAVLDSASDPGVVVENGLNLYKVTQDTLTSTTTSDTTDTTTDSTSDADSVSL